MKEIVLGLGAMAVAATGLVPQKKAVTYTETIRPIISAKCLPCHSKATNIGPFDFSTYKEVTSRIELIRTQALSRNMPPIWAHSDYGKFSKIEHLTDEEAVQLQDWIRLKMPMGPSVASDPIKTSPSHAGPEPDLTITFAKNIKVRAEGVPYWSVVSTDLPAKGGRIENLNLIPANPRVIRYATIAIVPKAMMLPKETTGSMDLPSKYLVGTWAPGYSGIILPHDMSRTYGPSSKLVVQVHYRPTGKPENGGFAVNIFNPITTPTKVPSWITMEDKDVFIPAGESKVVELTKPVSTDLTLISLMPEARFYAGQIQLLYTSKEGKTTTVLDAVRWDPYWGANYQFPVPVKLVAGGTLTARFHYNNDKYCRINEGKKLKDIKAGPSASDEVCRMHLQISP